MIEALLLYKLSTWTQFIISHFAKTIQNQPFNFLPKDSLELVAHETVNDEVSGGIENKEEVHETGQTEEPGWGCEMGAAEDETDEKGWKLRYTS